MSSPTMLEGLLVALAQAFSRLQGGDAEGAAQAVAHAASLCTPGQPVAPEDAERAAQAQALLAEAEALAGRVQSQLEDELRRIGNLARASEAYGRSASGG